MKGKFRRNHNLSHIKLTKSYSVEDICQTFRVHSGTVYQWKKRGLQIIEGSYPNLFHGTHLLAFLKTEKVARTHKCGEGEFYCFKCRAPRKPKPGSVQQIPKSQKVINLSAVCDVCGCKIFKSASAQNQPNAHKTPLIPEVHLMTIEGFDTRTTNTQSEEV